MRHLPRLVLPALSTSADHWEPLRRPARHNDEALTGTTRAWLRKLPASRRPQQLCIQFPRIANLLAWHWRDPVQVHQLLDDLLHDRRGSRDGFPVAVVQELRRLHDFNRHIGDVVQAPSYLDVLRRIWPRH